MSARRVKKGLGRRPMSEKRRQFLELLARGRSLRGACIERGSRGRPATFGRTAPGRAARVARSRSCHPWSCAATATPRGSTVPFTRMPLLRLAVDDPVPSSSWSKQNFVGL